MQENPTVILERYVLLARSFVLKTHFERYQIKDSSDAKTELLIDGLLDKLDRRIKEDRVLAKNLKALKQVLAKCGVELPKNQTPLEEELRTVLLDCGLDSAFIDTALSSNTTQEHANVKTEKANSTAEVQPAVSQVQVHLENESQGLSPEAQANRLKEEGNKYFMAKDYKNALLNYNHVLAMPNLPGDIFVKVASNQMAALVLWDGTTAEMIKDAKLNIEKALLIEMNPKLFYRYAQGQEWLGDLKGTALSLEMARKLRPDDYHILKYIAKVKQNMYYKAAKENLDERYHPKSESEDREKWKKQFPNFELNSFLSEAVPANFPPALVMQGHVERDYNKNYKAAAKLYERAGNAGDPEGLLNLAYLYTLGLGVKQDVYTAVDLLKRAVKFSPKKQGVVESYNALGMKYMRGTGVELDLTEAKYWFQKSADLGLPEGELNLGCVLKMERKYSEAMEVFKSAAAKGCARAYANMGDLFRDGHGVKKNLEKARQLYEKAVASGLSMDVEAELKQEAKTSSIASWCEQDEKMAKLETMTAEMTEDALIDLEKQADFSDTAHRILIGWQNYQQGIKTLYTMETNAHDDYILEMFSSAIQSCGHFLKLSEDVEYYLKMVVDDVLKNGTKVNPIDLAVCGFYLRYPPSDLPNVMKTNSYVAARSALELSELGEPQKALQIIHWAIAQDPYNLDLRFYKARITKTLDTYLSFINRAPSDHYWVPKAYFCLADIFMKSNRAQKTFEMYQRGILAERTQLKLFQRAQDELEEKRTVAMYLMSKNILNRCPPFLKINDVRRKELIVHQHNKLKDTLKILTTPVEEGTVTVRTSIEHVRQPDPTTKSRQQELFFEDLDFSKEFIYEGFTDCLILAPPSKIEGIFTVVEDKRGNTSRILIYDDISLMHIRVGQWIRIYNPYVRIAGDQRSAIKVTNKNCFEVLHFEQMCHYCTDPESDLLFCQKCKESFYCSRNCFTKHWYDYQHNVVCPYLKLERNAKSSTE